MSISAMKQALEAFRKIHEGCGEVKKDNLSKESNELATLVRKDCNFAMDALRQAIEFEEMVKKGTKAWADTPDDWVDDLRGGAEKQESYDPMERNADYERGFIDGRADQMKSSVDRAVNRMAQREWVGLDGDIPDLGLVTEEFYNGMLCAEDILRKRNT